MKEVERIKIDHNIDLDLEKNVLDVMNKLHLLGFVIVDPGTETVKMITDNKKQVHGKVIDINIYCNNPEILDSHYYAQLKMYYNENPIYLDCYNIYLYLLLYHVLVSYHQKSLTCSDY